MLIINVLKYIRNISFVRPLLYGIKKSKIGRFLVVLTSMVFLLSSFTTYNKRKFSNASDLLFTKPDSTLQLLYEIRKKDQLNPTEKEKINLLEYHALYRLAKIDTLDQKFYKTLHYFRVAKLQKEEGIASYLLGCSYIERNKDSAFYYFKHAEIYLEKQNEPIIMGLTEFNLGDIYLNKEDYGFSMDYFTAARKDFLLTKDTFHLAYVNSRIAESLSLLDQSHDSIMKYLNESIVEAKLSKNNSLLMYNLLKKGEFLQPVRHKESKKILLGLNKAKYSNNRLNILLAQVYIKEGLMDSAMHFLKNAKFEYTSKRDRLNYFITYSKIAKQKSDFTTALSFLEKSYLLRDSIYNDKTKIQAREIDRKLELANLERENLQLNLKQRNFLLIGISIVVFLIILVTIIIFNNQSNKRRLEKAELINLNKQKELEFNRETNYQKKKLFQTMISYQIHTAAKLKELKRNETKLETIKNEIIEQFSISYDDWDNYIAEADSIYDGKISYLKEKYPNITRNDLIMILLIWHRVDITDCSMILNVGKWAVYHRRQIIKDRLKLGKEDILDEWLLNLIDFSKQLTRSNSPESSSNSPGI